MMAELFICLFRILEIDFRLKKFLDSVEKKSVAWMSVLELTDAIIYERKKNGEVVVYRGGSCTFPLYWRSQGNPIHISTRLPIQEGNGFSREYFSLFFANLCLQSSYEPNITTRTPLANWRRFRRGAITRFENGQFIEEMVYFHEVNKNASLEEIINNIETAFNDYGALQTAQVKSVLELSGGFDSTLAASAAPNALPRMLGVSVEFPFYEFRHEAATQIAVAKNLGIDRLILDGCLEFPYESAEKPPKFDEPTVFVTGLRHAERVAAIAHDYRASRLYVGHGGDQLFATNLLDQDPVSDFKIDQNLFDNKSIQLIKSYLPQFTNNPWLQRNTGCFVYDACIDVWMKETYGLNVRTPFSDLKLFRAALEWSHWCNNQTVRPDKSILARSMKRFIPDAVLNRKGKVAYDGVWLRGYTQHADKISDHFEQTASVLEFLGLSPTWLVHRVKQIAEWKEVSTKEVLAAYAISNWLLCHKFLRPEDVTWAE
ncbi:MAG: hypothetical protein IPP34_11580 [Bacteroidetes bacterium]|nr:hypothetical protein [Bacteroidota bacterium]